MPARATRRRPRDEVIATVRRATLELAERAPFTDLTVEEIARAGGISRTAFYFYFRSKRDLLLAAMQEVMEEIYLQADLWWHGEGPPEKLVRSAIEGGFGIYAKHAQLLGAAQEVAMYDQEVGERWRAIVERFVTATAAHLRREQAAGRLRPIDVDAAAESLVFMMERCQYVYLSLEGRPIEEVVETLTAIWVHALYPDAPSR